MDDPELIDLIISAQDGDARAFEALVSDHYEVMFKMAYKWCGNKDLAEDITQDACIKLARGINSFNMKSKFSSWLYRLVINCGRDLVKKDARHPENPDALEFVLKLDQKEDRAYARQILRAVYALPDREREALLLVMNDGYSHAEAGRILGVKEGTISWRISEARKKLNEQFGGYP